MPTLTTSLTVTAGNNTNTLTTSSFTPSAGDVIVVKGAIEFTDVGIHLNTPTDTQGNTYTQWGLDNSASHCWVGLWTTKATSATSMTVSVSISAAANHSMTVEQWTNADLASTPAVNSTTTGTGAPTSTLTTSQSLSAVSWLSADWNANSPSGRVYNTSSATPVEEGLHDVSPLHYVAYYAYQGAGSLGSQTLGLTSPTGQTWSLLAVEVLDVALPGSPQDPNQTEPLKLWQ